MNGVDRQLSLVRVYHRCTFRVESSLRRYIHVRNGFGSQCSWMLTDTDRNQQRIGNCWAQSLVTGSCITDINYLVSDSDRVALGCYSRCRFQMRRITSASVLIKFVEVLILMTISDTNISGLCSHNVISILLLSSDLLDYKSTRVWSCLLSKSNRTK